MLNKPTIIIHEERAIERRGKKRASPLLEMSLSYNEEVIANLLKINAFTDGNESLYEAEASDNTLELVTQLGHLARQSAFKRKHRQ